MIYVIQGNKITFIVIVIVILFIIIVLIIAVIDEKMINEST